MIELTNIVKEYQGTGGAFRAVDDVTLTIQTGEVFGIIGYSGAGKSTLVRCINLLERPTSGTVRVDGRDVTALTGAELRRERQSIGIIFQHFNLFPSRTVAQNVAFPLAKLGLSREEIDARVTELLALVELSDKTAAYPEQLSGGQKQRVAIARALATRPSVLLCDEATSALDPTTTHSILSLLKQLNRDLGLTIVVITHQMSVVKEICTHVAILDDGEVVEDGLVPAVFSAPRSQAARHLVFPGGADAAVSDPSQERRIRLIFRSAQTTAIPMVARLAAEESIYANVISASTQKLSEEVYGSMLLGIPNSQFDRAWQFFRTIPNLQAEEVSVDVQ